MAKTVARTAPLTVSKQGARAWGIFRGNVLIEGGFFDKNAALEALDSLHKTVARLEAPTAPAAPPAPTTKQVAIDITSPAEAKQGLALVDQARGFVVKDKVSHGQAKEFVGGAKKLKRAIEEHWSHITRGVDELKRNLLMLKGKDLEPVETAIKIASDVVIAYDNAEAERVRIEQDRLRREEERKARERRDREQAEQEAEALRLEAQSPKLSAREQEFIDQMFIGGKGATVAAQLAGFKDPAETAARLMRTQKIVDAIATAKAAKEIRRQAEEQARKPLDVKPVRKVESNTAHVHGMTSRTYYSAAVEDFDKLVDAVIAGTAPRSALTFNQTALNEAAKGSPTLFEELYPGCRLVKRQGLAG